MNADDLRAAQAPGKNLDRDAPQAVRIALCGRVGATFAAAAASRKTAPRSGEGFADGDLDFRGQTLSTRAARDGAALRAPPPSTSRAR